MNVRQFRFLLLSLLFLLNFLKSDSENLKKLIYFTDGQCVGACLDSDNPNDYFYYKGEKCKAYWQAPINYDFRFLPYKNSVVGCPVLAINDSFLMVNDVSRMLRPQFVGKSKKQQRIEERDVKNRKEEFDKHERINFHNQTKVVFTDPVLYKQCLIDKPADIEFQNFTNNLLNIVFENITDNVIKNYDLSLQTQQLLRDNFVDPNDFKELEGSAEQQSLMQKLVDVLNQAAQIKAAYFQARPVNNISNLIARMSNYAFISFKNKNLNSSVLYTKFCDKLLEVEKCYIRLLNRGFEIGLFHPENGVLPEFFEQLRASIYEYSWEEAYKSFLKENNKYGGKDFYEAKLRDKYLTDDYFKVCGEAKKILSDLLFLNCENLEQFKKDFIILDENTSYSDDYCNKVRQNILILVHHLNLQNQDSVNRIALDAFEEIKFARTLESSSNIYKILAPIKDIFYEAGVIARSKVDQEIIKRNTEIEEEQKVLSRVKAWHENEILKQQENFELEVNSKPHTDLSNLISDFNDAIADPKSEFDSKIAKCGLDFAKNLEEAIEDEDFIETSCNEKRLNITKELILNSEARVKSEQIFKLSDRVKRELISLNENLSDYEKFNGNKLQHQLHHEIIETLNESAELVEAFSGNKPILGINRFIHCSSNLAIACNKSEEIQRGFALEDLSKSLLDLGKQIADYYFLVGECACRGSWATGKGCAKGAWNSVCFAGNTIRHPIKTTKETIETLGNIAYWAGYLTFYKIPVAFNKACELACTNQDEFIRKACEYASQIKNLTKNGCIYAYNNPEEVIEKTSEILTTFLCGNKMPTFQGALFNNLKGLSTCLVEEVKIAKALKQTQNLNFVELPNLSLKSINSPIKQVLKNVFAINQIKKEHGNEVLDVILKLVKEEPAVLQGRGLQKLLNPKIFAIENLNYRMVRPKDDLYAATIWVDQEYEKIRNSKNDIDCITKNVGFTQQSIQKIKDHLFYKKHILNDSKMDFFDADIEIASAWNRLTDGDFIINDIQLLQHEIIELYFERELNLNYSQAHYKAKMFFDWSVPCLRR